MNYYSYLLDKNLYMNRVKSLAQDQAAVCARAMMELHRTCIHCFPSYSKLPHRTWSESKNTPNIFCMLILMKQLCVDAVDLELGVQSSPLIS